MRRGVNLAIARRPLRDPDPRSTLAYSRPTVDDKHNALNGRAGGADLSQQRRAYAKRIRAGQEAPRRGRRTPVSCRSPIKDGWRHVRGVAQSG